MPQRQGCLQQQHLLLQQWTCRAQEGTVSNCWVKMQVGEQRNPTKAGGEENQVTEEKEAHWDSLAEWYLVSPQGFK